MDSLLDAALRNAALAVPLAALVLILGIVFRRPALLHVLWIVVLLRLLMPPIWNVSVPRPIAPEPVVAETSTLTIDIEDAAPPQPAKGQAAAEEHAPSIWWQVVLDSTAGAAPVAEPAADSASPVDEAAGVKPSATAITLPPWRTLVGMVWLAGSGLLALLAALRLGQFMVALRASVRDPQPIQAEADAIAQRLGLRASPRVAVIDACVSPMLWGFFTRPRLVLPATLWSKLTPSQRSTLLAHELAHYGRGDHWVRWLELAATILFWWHPVVWLARWRLREAEEQCWDGWVIWALPDSRRDYATAIVDTVGFLSTGRPGLPALASGVGEVRHLRRRLTMIMRGNTSRRLPRLALAALFGGGLALGMVAPTWGDDDRRDPPPAERREENRRDSRREERPRDDGPRDERRADADRAREQARAELERARADFERARQRLEELERRLNQRDPNQPRIAPPAAAGRGDGGRPSVPGTPQFPRTPTPPGAPEALPGARRAGGGPIEQRMDALERRLEEVTRLLEEMRREQRGRGAGERGGPGGGGGGGGPGRGPRGGSGGGPGLGG